MTRKIIHCDADCFFAAIEMRDNPRLHHRPLAVGGSSNRRGVICTCNYEARQYGVRSAMASAYAQKLCPDLLIIPPNMEKYKKASEYMTEIFKDYTYRIEPLSLDEAYLDVTQSSACAGSATRMAEEIRQRVRKELGITVSAGVSNSKFLAKIASDWNKPDGIHVVTPADAGAFVQKLPVNKIHGVGKVTNKKLEDMGIKTCADLRQFEQHELEAYFGSFGPRLYELARGIDNREVDHERIRKSLSVEHTFAHDLKSPALCQEKVPQLIGDLKFRLERLNERYQISKAFVKVKFSDFTTTTLERSCQKPDIDSYSLLLKQALERSSLHIRLLGLGVRLDYNASEQLPVQLSLFDP